jgi:hypothetical protein
MRMCPRRPSEARVLGATVLLAWCTLSGAQTVFSAFGDACLPRDVISLVRSEVVESVSHSCTVHDNNDCSAECLQAIQAFKAEPCYRYLTQPQTRQPRHGAVSLSAMQGIWYGMYPASGVELLELKYEPQKETLVATKLTGNQFVQAGRVTWEATPTGCRVVSSVWANVHTPRWDPCTVRALPRPALPYAAIRHHPPPPASPCLLPMPLPMSLICEPCLRDMCSLPLPCAAPMPAAYHVEGPHLN